MSKPPTDSAALPIVLYSRGTRALAGALKVTATATLVILLVVLATSTDPVNPLALIRWVALGWLLPTTAAAALRSWLAGSARVGSDRLTLHAAQQRIEIPLASIRRVDPWLVPIPQPGMTFHLASGRRWERGIACVDPAPLLQSLRSSAASPQPRPGRLATAALVYGRISAPARSLSWLQRLLQYPLFALVPTIPLFRVHQIIAYGGAFGELQQYGAGAYLGGFAIYWATLTIYLMLFATALRIPIEAVSAITALYAPAISESVRKLLDRIAAVVYYAGVPMAVVLRFVPW